jgi:hypothetical protein
MCGRSQTFGDFVGSMSARCDKIAGDVEVEMACQVRYETPPVLAWRPGVIE